MKQVRCKGCWTNFSNAMHECPQCHTPAPKRPPRRRLVLAGVGVGLSCALLATAWVLTDPKRRALPLAARAR